MRWHWLSFLINGLPPRRHYSLLPVNSCQAVSEQSSLWGEVTADKGVPHQLSTWAKRLIPLKARRTWQLSEMCLAASVNGKLFPLWIKVVGLHMCFSQLQRVPAQHSDWGSHANTFNVQKGCATWKLRPQTPEDTLAGCYQSQWVWKEQTSWLEEGLADSLSLWKSHTLSPPQRQLRTDVTLLSLYMCCPKASNLL